MASAPYITPPIITTGTAAIADASTMTRVAAEALLPRATVETPYPGEVNDAVPFMDKGNALANAAARFAPFAEDTPYASDVHKILDEQPMMQDQNGKPIAPNMPTLGDIDMFVRGELRYPRAESLHQLLSNGRSTWDTIAVENGSGAVPHLSMIITSMGSRIFIKEPSEALGRSLLRFSTNKLPVEWLRRREPLFDKESVARPTPAHIVYWVNPTPTMFKVLEKTWDMTPESLARLANYIGRDVLLGGYLLIQTDIEGTEIYHDLPFDISTWFPVFDGIIEGKDDMRGAVLPTTFYNLNNQLRIFRRIAG